MRSPLAVLLAALLLAPGSLHAGDPDPEPVGTVLIGEQLSPAQLGQGFVEGLAEVQDRFAHEPAGEGPTEGLAQIGVWRVPSLRAIYYPRGTRNVVNTWGDTLMGIRFPQRVDVQGAYFAGQSEEAVWAPALRAKGFRGGSQVGVTAWFANLSTTPTWFAMDFRDVDRIVIEAQPAMNGRGWYAMDDLTYVPLPPSPQAGQTIVVTFEDTAPGQTLTGTNYADLTWERGRGTHLLPGPAEGDVIPSPEGLREAVGPQEPDAPAVGPRGGAGHNPVLLATMQGAVRGDAGSFSAPPDTCGAVGPTQFVEVVNRIYTVFDKTTLLPTAPPVTLTAFQPGTSGDPRVLFDQYSGRWIVISSDFNSRLYLAVSTTSDANGTWFKTNFVASTGSDSGCFPDYPTLGVDADGIYTAAFMASTGMGTCGMTIFVIDKAPLIAPVPSLGTITAFRALPFEGAIQPVHTYGTPATPGEYLISRQNNTLMRVRRRTGPMTSPTLTTVASITVPSNSQPPLAPALGSSPSLDTVDTRLMNAVYRNGSIWAAHTINVGGRAGVRWYEFSEATMTLAQNGTIDDPVRTYFFPALSVNANGHMIIGFSGSSPSEYASCYYAGRGATDPLGQTSPPTLYKAGVASQNIIDSFGRNRFGDYSLTTVDPSDDLTFWTLQEYVHDTDIWGTYAAKLTYELVDFVAPSPDPMSFSIAPSPASTSSISMQATLATDVMSPPVQYFFDFQFGAGGHDSPWNISRDYTDAGLIANASYTYRVQARDSANPANTTGFSNSVTTATHIQTPTGQSFGTTTPNSIQVSADGTFNALTAGLSGLFFEMTPDVPGSGANQWVQTASINVVGLTPGATYTFRVKARNRLGVETPFTPASDKATPALPGDCDGNGLFELGPDTDCFVEVLLGNELDAGKIARSDFDGDLTPTGDDVAGYIDCAVNGCP